MIRPPALRLSLDELIADPSALFVLSHSGGKDSQAMMIHVLGRVPASRLLVVHASLGEMEWPGALEHAENQATQAGVPFVVARASKTLLGMVEHRFQTRPAVPSWPSASTRQCTSDLKRGPIKREVRRYADAQGFTQIVECMGLRAAESPARAKRAEFGVSLGETNSRRDWYEWLPIHAWSTERVFATIAQAGQQPHPAYALGNDRLSCVFCIMASRNDLRNGAKHNPELYAHYVELERRTGYTMHQSRKSLAELVGGDDIVEAQFGIASQREEVA